MTFNTIRRKVRPGQGEHRRIVVKSRRRPGRFRVASCAICWELVYDVIGVTHAVVVGLVAAYAGVWCVVIVTVNMALVA